MCELWAPLQLARGRQHLRMRGTVQAHVPQRHRVEGQATAEEGGSGFPEGRWICGLGTLEALEVLCNLGVSGLQQGEKIIFLRPPWNKRQINKQKLSHMYTS